MLRIIVTFVVFLCSAAVLAGVTGTATPSNHHSHKEQKPTSNNAGSNEGNISEDTRESSEH